MRGVTRPAASMPELLITWPVSRISVPPSASIVPAASLTRVSEPISEPVPSPIVPLPKIVLFTLVSVEVPTAMIMFAAGIEVGWVVGGRNQIAPSPVSD